MIIREKHMKVLLILLLLSCMLSGATILSYLRIPRIWVCGLLGLFTVFMGKKDTFFENKYLKWYAYWVLFLTANIFWSYSMGESLRGWSVFVAIIGILMVDYEEEDLVLLWGLIRIICIVYAFSIIVSAILPGFFYSTFSILLANAQSLKTEVAAGSFSGLVGEKALAAFLMNVGIILELAILSAKEKKIVNYSLILIYFFAMMLTGKRSFFIISVFVFGAFFLWSKEPGKWKKLCLGACVLVPLAVAVVAVVPQVSVVFDRFSEFSGDDALNGRTWFWEICWGMFLRKPLLGFGFASFNDVFGDEVHYIYHGELWNMYAHNIYVEMLAEIGLVGTVLFAIAAIGTYVDSIRLLRNKALSQKDQSYVFAAFGIQSLFLIYGITGNGMYQHEQLLFYFLTYSIIFFVKQKNGMLSGERKFSVYWGD